MGLERTVAVLNGKKSAYETDLFEPIISQVCLGLGIAYEQNKETARIIADHIKASVFLIKDGVTPGNKMGEYVLRRLLRRAAAKAFLIDKGKSNRGFFRSLVKPVMDIYLEYFEETDMVIIGDIVSVEVGKFRATIANGLKRLDESVKNGENLGLAVFNLFQSYGFPLEVTVELLKERGIVFNNHDMQQFEEGKRMHSELSRTASVGMFKGGLAGHSEIETKYHTATHLLHQALRDILGPEVFQKGSNINQERLRFDFSYDKKMTEEEINKTEELVNGLIKQDLKVERQFMSVPEAQKMNAIGLFTGKYDETVSIYEIGPDFKLDPEARDQRERGGYYSAEFCGGPHVEHTGEIGGLPAGRQEFKITKEESVSAGVRRIYAELI